MVHLQFVGHKQANHLFLILILLYFCRGMVCSALKGSSQFYFEIFIGYFSVALSPFKV